MLMPFEDWPEKDRSDIVILRALLCVLDLRRELPQEVIANLPSRSRLIATADLVARDIGWGEEAGLH